MKSIEPSNGRGSQVAALLQEIEHETITTFPLACSDRSSVHASSAGGAFFT